MEDFKRIDVDLYNSVKDDAWFHLPYTELLASDPKAVREAEKALEAEYEIPESLVVENKIIPGNKDIPDVGVRVYRKKDANQAPVMLYFHGGGFVFGCPQQNDALLCNLVLDSSCIIVSVDYRLAPENPFPAATEDGYHALCWISEHGAEIMADPQKIIVGGGSAGGNLAIAMCIMARDRKGPVIHFQFLSYPVTDYSLSSPSMKEFTDTPFWNLQNAIDSWKYYIGENPRDVSPYASPLSLKNFSSLPPAFIMVCELDPLRDEGIAYAQKLMQTGISVELQVIPRVFHVFNLFPSKLSERFYQTQVRVLNEVFGWF